MTRFLTTSFVLSATLLGAVAFASSVEAGPRHGEIFFGKNKGQEVISTAQKGLRVQKEQLDSLEGVETKLTEMSKTILELQKQLVAQQEQTNAILQQLAEQNAEQTELMKEQASLMESDFGTGGLDDIVSNAGGAYSGSITYRIKP